MQAMPQAANPNMAAFMQGQGGMPSQGMQPPMSLGNPPMPSPMGPINGQPPQGPSSPQQPQGQLDPKIQQLIQMLMKQGRGGDTMMAHLTPGEMEVPPEIQTPKVLATLKKAYQDKGVDPAQFTAGSPQSSINPSTGLPEYNFMSAFLPAALGIAGSVAMPYLAPEIGSALLASSVGGGVGTALGGLAAGQKPTQALLAGAGAGAGGYGLGSLAGGAASAAGSAGEQAAAAIPASSAAGPTVANLNASMAPQIASNYANSLGGIMPQGMASGLGNASSSVANTAASAAPSNSMLTMGGLLKNPINPYQAIGSTVGGQFGNMLGAPVKPQGPKYPPGFNDPMTPLSQLPSYQVGLGQNQYKGPNASFNNFNPATNYPAAYNHFPVM